MNTKKTAKAVLATFGLSVLLPTAAMAAVDTQNHWAGSVMEKWEKQALLGGYEDGTIRPDGQITRAEFVALVNRAGGYQPAANAVTFSDVKAGDWYAGQVAAAVNQGYIGGFEDGTFRPNENITREQAAAIIARLHKLPSDPARAEQFADADNIAAWAKGVVGAVANAGYMVGDSNNNFNGAKAMTRAEAVSSLDRVFKIEDVKAEKLTISLSQPIGTINKGAVKTIIVTASVKDAVIKATSSNPSVATVTVEGNKVIIRGLEKGSVTITITASAPGYQDAVVTSDNAVAIGGGGGGGGSTYVPPTTKPEIEVKPSEGVQDKAEEKATEAVGTVVTNKLPATTVSDDKKTVMIDTEEKKTAVVNEFKTIAEADTSTTTVTEVEKYAAQAIVDYLDGTTTATVEVSTLQAVAQEKVKAEVQAQTQEVAAKVSEAVNDPTSTEVKVEVPALLQEVTTKVVVEPATSKATANVGSTSITLRNDALEDLQVSVAKGERETKSLTVKDVLTDSNITISNTVRETLNARENKDEALVTGTVSYGNDGKLSVQWSSTVSSFTAEQANDFMRNFGIAFVSNN